MIKKIKRILVANRGEIAIRIIKTCRQMDIETVTLYTDEEKELPHSFFGDYAVCLGSGALSETYLNIDKMIEICKKFSVDAIHPGYGFLSENPVFRTRVEKEGFIFIGPSAHSMEMMGDKIRSKVEMQKIGTPLIPGYHGECQDSNFLKEEAEKIGYPVLIKATAGGGGKGMRTVYSADDFIQGLDAAKREAQKAFGNDKVLIEKYIEKPRHIEIQVLSDSFDNHFHLFERECSIQRRHQKIVEETPSCALDAELREKMAKSAVNITRSINYLGAGTIEFILDTDESFYFLEMNTRLQVEHPVTEMVTGLDLVKCQILVAQGDKLPFTQDDITQSGHAIELRLYAEDPDNDFLPSVGTISHVGAPQLAYTRLDSGYEEGNKVSTSFDPMLAKLIAWSENREDAIKKSLQSLREVHFLGVKTNREYLQRILKHSSFLEGETYTDFVVQHKEDLKYVEGTKKEKALAVAAFLLSKKNIAKSKGEKREDEYDVWNFLGDFRV